MMREVQGRITKDVGEGCKVDTPRETITDGSQAPLQSKSILKEPNISVHKESVPKSAQDTSQEIVADVPVLRVNEDQGRITEVLLKTFKKEPSEETAPDRSQMLLQSEQSNGSLQKDSVSKCTSQDTLLETVAKKKVVQVSTIAEELRKRFKEMSPVKTSVDGYRAKSQSSQVMKNRDSREEVVKRSWERQRMSPHRKYRPYYMAKSHQRRPQSRSPPRDRYTIRVSVESKRRRDPMPRKDEAQPCKRRRETERIVRMEAVSARRSRSRDRRLFSRHRVTRSPVKRARSRTRLQAESRTARSPSTDRCRKLENTKVSATENIAVVLNPRGESQGESKREMERLKLALVQLQVSAPEMLAKPIGAAREIEEENALCEPQREKVEAATSAEMERAAPLQTETLPIATAKPESRNSESSPGEPHNQGTIGREEEETPAEDKRTAPEATQDHSMKSATIVSENSEHFSGRPSGKKCKPIKIVLSRVKRVVLGQTPEAPFATTSPAVTETVRTSPQAGEEVSDRGTPYYVIKQEVPEQTQTLLEEGNSTAAEEAPSESSGLLSRGFQSTPSTTKPAMPTQMPQAACNAVSETAENGHESSNEKTRGDLELLQSWLALVQRANSVLSAMPEKLSPLASDSLSGSDTATPTVPQKIPCLDTPEVDPNAFDSHPKREPVPELEDERVPQEGSVDASIGKTSFQDAVAVPEGHGKTSEPEIEAVSKVESDMAPETDAEMESEAAQNKVRN